MTVKYVATKVTENGVTKWVTKPLLEEAIQPLRSVAQQGTKEDSTGYSYYGILGDNN
jgi:hypothetical protein|tara:strand:+ start:1167 stop:1337 length:171 start_codon:yes stop_codon:yes gene_type:complete